MGAVCSANRSRRIELARAVQVVQASLSPQLERHARAILHIVETIAVGSHERDILTMAPAATRSLVAP